jgi:PhoPQ-activated pathogenicity-related protein
MKMKQFFKGILFVLIPILGFSQTKITPEKALKSYISNGDPTYSWELKDSTSLGSSKAYQLVLTSQKWRGITWRHQLTIVVPSTIQYDGAMLFITGGSNKDEQPNWSKEDKMWPILAAIASKNKAIVALIKQVPNQPLYDGKT